MTLHGCQLSFLQVQQAHHLSILTSPEGLAGLPGTDAVEVVGLDSGSCSREGLCKESLIIIMAGGIIFCQVVTFIYSFIDAFSTTPAKMYINNRQDFLVIELKPIS